MEEFRKFLNQFRCEKGSGVQYTHTSIGNPRASYAVPPNRMDDFYEAYNRAMVKGVSLHFTEKPSDPSPMRADLDFRFPMKSPKPEKLERIYTIEHMKSIVAAYGALIAQYIDPAHHDKIIAYVMEKSVPTEYRGKLKDGLHIVWPGIVLPHTLHHLIRKHMLNDAAATFNGLSVCNTYEEIIDNAIIDRNNWQMYGSKKPDCEAYRVTGVYRYVDTGIEVMDLPSAIDELGFARLFSMRDKTAVATPICEDKIGEIEEYIRHVLPSHGEKRMSKLNTQIFGKSVNMNRNVVNEDDFILAKELVECLNPKRAENYEEWIKLGWTLRNIDHRLLDTWVEFSRVSSKYIEGECQKLWNTMRTDTMGMGTMRWWARHDNPQKYEEIRNSNVIALIDRCCGSNGAHYDVACVVHALYKDKYRFTTKDTWYMYVEDKHRWVRTREGLKLRLVLSNDVWRRFADRSFYWSNEGGKVTDQSEQERYNQKSRTLSEVCTRLKSAGYKDSVMKECKGLFTDELFEEVLDSHMHLLGFENGVYDLRLHEFREGLPDDFISFCTGRHYFDYNKESLEAVEIEAYLAQVFTNDNVRGYMKSMLACIIDGSIRQEKFYIFTGSGCHAKDTEILMIDGSKKLVQDITTSDVLMGDDSTPRKVLQLFRGSAMMYRIVSEDGDTFVVNEDHKISLRVARSPYIDDNSGEYRVKCIYRSFSSPEDGSIVLLEQSRFRSLRAAHEYMVRLETDPNVLHMGDVIDVQVKNYVHFRMHTLELDLFKAGVAFESAPVPSDPYDYGYNMGTDTRIPRAYLMNSRKVRLELLRGILEKQYGPSINDATIITMSLLDIGHIEDIAYLIRSLGMRCMVTKENITIQSLADLNYKFVVERLDVDYYYGFEVDRNHRYMMADFFVTANSNSKSIYLNLLQRAIGDYYCILPIALLTQKRTASNAAQSELERTKGRRCAVMQEPGESEKLNIGLMKELSGGDRILTRGLFKEPIEFKPQFKMVMTCNELPEVPSDDGGTWRRIRVIEYTSRFVDKPDASKPREFPIDPDIVDKLDRWADTFISMIIDHHRKMDAKAIDEPLEVRIATEGYKKNNDIIGQYVVDKIIRDPDTVERVQLLKLFQDFKNWAYQNVPKGKKLPDRSQFRAYVEKTFGAYPSDGKGWKGIRVKKSGTVTDENDSDAE